MALSVETEPGLEPGAERSSLGGRVRANTLSYNAYHLNTFYPDQHRRVDAYHQRVPYG